VPTRIGGKRVRVRPEVFSYVSSSIVPTRIGGKRVRVRPEVFSYVGET
jgi:hypothetical protein